MTDHPRGILPGDERADALLQGLVEHDSPSRQEKAAVHYLVDQMRDLGFQATVDGAGNAVGETGRGERTIVLLGHIDTVPGKIDVRRERNLLYGRGTVDAKGPLCAFVVAASRAGHQAGKRIIVVGAVEEEAATSKGARYLLDRLSPETVIIGEPSGWDRVTVGYKGRLLADYTHRQAMGHTAGPEQRACEQAVAFWQHVVEYAERWNAGRERVFSQLTPSLRSICSTDDGLEESAAMTVGFRLPPGIEIAKLQQALVEMAQHAQVRLYGQEAAFRASKNNALVRAFLQAIRAQGGQPAFQVKSGTSDMNVVGPVWRCSILA
jgi:LysW-gamma-L-lysine carboxypeptidase